MSENPTTRRQTHKPKAKSRKSHAWHGFTPAQLQARRSAVPALVYPQQLPVCARRQEIAQAIAAHQVVIVAGETGSGKTTQLPKICLELGRGVNAMIGHTQPRRLAARTVAERIAQELGTSVNKQGIVGYQVRFTEQVGALTLIKLMTDGILLAEIQTDPLLKRYDTIIVDEAHERSLNIDFILGYLARLLPKRPDLKVIITSATIDCERFAQHFARALGAPQPARLPQTTGEGAATLEACPAASTTVPIIEVHGRTYPVQIRYRPLLDEQSGIERDQISAITAAVDELMTAGGGDILVFLAGERDIHDTHAALISHLGARYSVDSQARTRDAVEVVPLFSRLTSAAQHKVFEPHSTRRIVLATNVAETSLTVPGIRYVIDPGLARISRYSNRTKVQRLPIEPISQASANQRSGRCGRVADGIAIRLYSQADYESRPQYTQPEILRTSLASVILQMAALGLGRVADFPFLDAPDPRAVRDGVQLLTEIGALQAKPERGRNRTPRLTAIGRRLARLPIDPRLGRMLLEAQTLSCAGEVMVIVSALSIQDVRERPLDQQEQADAMHRRFADPSSDFLTYLHLWCYLHTQRRELSGAAFRRLCKSEYLHYLRIREWEDVHAQLQQLSRAVGIHTHRVELPSAQALRQADKASAPAAEQAAQAPVVAAVMALGRSADTPDADAIHRSLLVGLLSNVGNWDERRREYAGARGSHFSIWPGSGLRRKTYPWVMSAELVETSRLFARTVAKVDPAWIEAAARKAGLARQVFSQPYWSTKKGCAMVHEKVLVYGMTVVADRPTTLVSVGTEAARTVAREMFIRNGLVEHGWQSRHSFVKRNQQLLAQVSEVENRRREHGLLAGEQALFHFYDERIPAQVTGAIAFDAWWKTAAKAQPDLLDFTRELLLPGGHDTAGYPDTWTQGDLRLRLEYVFDPHSAVDGISLLIPLEVLNQLTAAGFDWLVPGARPQLVVATIRALPKPVRRQLVPAPDVGAQIGTLLAKNYPLPKRASAPETSFQAAFSATVQQLKGVEIIDADWEYAQAHLPTHLQLTFVVLDPQGEAIARGKDLLYLQRTLAPRSKQAVRTAVAQAMLEAQTRQNTGEAVKVAPASTKQTRTGATKPHARAVASNSSLRAPLVEQTGLTDWPSGVPGLEAPNHSTIPPVIELTGASGLVVRGYPALVPATASSVNLAILPDAAAQHRAQGTAVTRLVLARTQLPTARVTSRWNAAQALALAASPYPSTPALVTDIQLAAAQSVAQQWAQANAQPLDQVRRQEVFAALVSYARQALEDEVYRVAQISARTLTAVRELERATRAHTSIALLAVLQQVREHSARLVYDGFISETPPAQLPYLPRFIQALTVRVNKAENSLAQDAANAYQIEQAEQLLAQARQRAAKDPKNAQNDAILLQARWLLEELHVSLFAQTLGTSCKVSLKRINKLLANI